MSENKQLVRKNNGGGYNNVYPYSYTETVKDKKTGKSLEEILVSTNFLYLPYRGSKAATRLQVDERYRRKGLWVQYVTDLGSVIVEYYNSSDISDTEWVDDKYWAPYNSAQFNPGTIGLDALSQEAKDYLLTNSPVNTEDITRDNQSRLQLADRAYNPASFSGKGYKILRQNILNGTNVLAQSMILAANTVYEIRYDYDLQGQEVTIPEGCILRFEGGSLKNGNLRGNSTDVMASIYTIFSDNLNILGTWIVKRAYPEWFGAKGDGITDDKDSINKTINLLYSSGGGEVILNNRNYLSSQINLKTRVSLIGTTLGKAIITHNGEGEYLVYIAGDCCRNTIRNIGLYGKDKLNTGIYIENDNSLPKEADIIFPQYKEFYAYKYVYIEDCALSNFNIGIKINTVYAVYINNIHLIANNSGIISSMTDSFISNGYIEDNSLIGFILSGSNNKISNLKIIFNGRESTEYTKGVFRIFGARNSLIGIECQDNYKSAFEIAGTQNMLCNCLSNTDGYKKLETGEDATDLDHKYYGFIISNKDNVFINCSVSNYLNKEITKGIYYSPYLITTGELLPYYSDLDIKLNTSTTYSLYRSPVQSTGNVSLFNSLITNFEIEDIKENEYLISDKERYIVSSKKLLYTNSFSIYLDILIPNEVQSGIYIFKSNFLNIQLDKLNSKISVAGGNNNFIGGVSVPTSSLFDNRLKVLINISNNRVCTAEIAYYDNNSSSYNYTSRDMKLSDINDNIVKSTNVYLSNVGLKYYNIIVSNKLTDNSILTFGKNIIAYYNINTIIGINFSNYTNNFSIKTDWNYNLLPAVENFPDGYRMTLRENKKMYSSIRNVFYDSNGVKYGTKYSGTFAEKPIDEQNISIGFAYFCTDKQTSEGSTNGIMIYYKGDNVWVDALGRVVS
jgi:hypothetical protein